jgi:Tol biopolymer transport system component
MHRMKPRANPCRSTRTALALLITFTPFAASPLFATPPDLLIGYTRFRTNIPDSRHANVITMRAHLVHADGTTRRELAPELAQKPNQWTQFAGWSPDAKRAIIISCWEDPENAAWEEAHKNFRFNDGWLCDAVLLDLAALKTQNLTAVDRVSRYNTGLFFFPAPSQKLGFQAVIDGISHPFDMDPDGKNKRNLTAGKAEFTYGVNASPDGKRLAYHKNYQIYIANADGADPQHVDTGAPFNFVPQWSPDGKYLMFLSGEHYNCHPHLVRANGTGLRKLTDRNGYRGVVEFLDVPDFHGGSSDVPTWAADGKSIVYTAKIEDRTELFRADLAGNISQITHSPAGSLAYHPTVSPDGQWIIFGAKRDNVRRLYLIRTNGQNERPITPHEKNHAAMWPHWQPTPQ